MLRCVCCTAPHDSDTHLHVGRTVAAAAAASQQATAVTRLISVVSALRTRVDASEAAQRALSTRFADARRAAKESSARVAALEARTAESESHTRQILRVAHRLQSAVETLGTELETERSAHRASQEIAEKLRSTVSKHSAGLLRARPRQPRGSS